MAPKGIEQLEDTLEDSPLLAWRSSINLSHNETSAPEMAALGARWRAFPSGYEFD